MPQALDAAGQVQQAFAHPVSKEPECQVVEQRAQLLLMKLSSTNLSPVTYTLHTGASALMHRV